LHIAISLVKPELPPARGGVEKPERRGVGFVVQRQEFVLTECRLCVGAPLFVGELHLEHTRRKGLGHRADLAARQTLGRQIGGERDNVEKFDVARHGYVPRLQSARYKT
jgi:hypothetical protein